MPSTWPMRMLAASSPTATPRCCTVVSILDRLCQARLESRRVHRDIEQPTRLQARFTTAGEQRKEFRTQGDGPLVSQSHRLGEFALRVEPIAHLLDFRKPLPDGLFHLQKLRFGVWSIEKEIYTCVQGSKPGIIAVAASGRRVEEFQGKSFKFFLRCATKAPLRVERRV